MQGAAFHCDERRAIISCERTRKTGLQLPGAFANPNLHDVSVIGRRVRFQHSNRNAAFKLQNAYKHHYGQKKVAATRTRVALCLLNSMSLANVSSKFGEPPSTESIADFWNWFLQNETTLFEVHFGNVKTLNTLLDPQLNKKAKPGLLWEIGHDTHTNKREFVVSAGGFKDLFPAVIATIRAAPTGLEQRWSIIAFRGRNEQSFQSNEDLSGCILYYQGRGYPPHLIRYALTRDERKDKIGVMLFSLFQGLTEAERDFFMSIGFLYLDAYLGEYNVEMHVGDTVFSFGHTNVKSF